MPVNVITGTDQDDNLQGTASRDLFYAGLGNDNIFMTGRQDTAWGDGGNDTILGYSGGSTAYGGDGDDRIGSFATLSDAETRLFGGAGNDDISTSGQIPCIRAGAGDDSVAMYSTVSGTAYGGSGVDRLVLNFSGGDPDIRVVAVATGPGAGVQIGLTGFLTIDGFEKIVITTGNGDDYVRGGALGDTMFLGLGANTALGDGGDDYIAYSTGAQNFLDGGAGSDTLRVQQFQLDQALTLTVTGTTGVDGMGSQLTGFETWFVYGGQRGDSVQLGDGLDFFKGGGGQDTGLGMGGTDTLGGGSGDDLLFGGRGADRLTGGDGVDALTGGAGADRFVFGRLDEARDIIADFASGQDQIVITSWTLGQALPRGPVDDANFRLDAASGTGAQFVFRQGEAAGTRELIWDTNGSEAGGEALIATLLDDRLMVASDILIT